MISKEEIYLQVKNALIETFEFEEEQIQPEVSLADDLDFDSLDAVDLIVKLEEFTKKKINAEEFRSIRTVQDIVDTISQTIN